MLFISCGILGRIYFPLFFAVLVWCTMLRNVEITGYFIPVGYKGWFLFWWKLTEEICRYKFVFSLSLLHQFCWRMIDSSTFLGAGRDNDWKCPNCNNINFAFRAVCNMRKCNTPRPDNQVRDGSFMLSLSSYVTLPVRPWNIYVSYNLEVQSIHKHW